VKAGKCDFWQRFPFALRNSNLVKLSFDTPGPLSGLSGLFGLSGLSGLSGLVGLSVLTRGFLFERCEAISLPLLHNSYFLEYEIATPAAEGGN